MTLRARRRGTPCRTDASSAGHPRCIGAPAPAAPRGLHASWSDVRERHEARVVRAAITSRRSVGMQPQQGSRRG